MEKKLTFAADFSLFSHPFYPFIYAMATLLDDLKIGVQRFLYTIDDCYAQNSLLTWANFIPEISDELIPIEKQVGRQANAWELIYKYYCDKVDNAEMVKTAQKQAAEVEKRVKTQLQQIAELKKQAQDGEKASQDIHTQLANFKSQLHNLSQQQAQLIEEKAKLEALAANGTQEKDYKKIIKNLSEEIDQKDTAIAQNKAESENTETELWRQKELINQANLQAQQAEQLCKELQQQQLQISGRQHALMNNDDFLIEKAAFAYLEKLFKTALRYRHADEDYSEATGEEFIVKNAKVPKLWKNILTNLLNEPIPAASGALKKKKKGAIVAQLERNKEVKISEDLLAVTFLALKKHILSKTENWAVQTTSEYLYLPLSAGIYAKISFREKGRFIQSFAQGENGQDLEVFVNLHEQAATDSAQSHNVHAQLTVQTVQDLYILYDKYVIEIDFKPAAVLL
jgi:hypothetical protein